MGQVNSIINLVTLENIDCKKIMFKGGKPELVDGDTIYYDAELLILKTPNGREVFNSLVSRFNWHYNKTPLDSIQAYPFYAVTFDMFSGSYHYGNWRYYNDLESLTEDFEVDSMEDAFQSFERDMKYIVLGEDE